METSHFSSAVRCVRQMSRRRRVKKNPDVTAYKIIVTIHVRFAKRLLLRLLALVAVRLIRSALVSIIVVDRRRARLVAGWVNRLLAGKPISSWNQPPKLRSLLFAKAEISRQIEIYSRETRKKTTIVIVKHNLSGRPMFRIKLPSVKWAERAKNSRRSMLHVIERIYIHYGHCMDY